MGKHLHFSPHSQLPRMWFFCALARLVTCCRSMYPTVIRHVMSRVELVASLLIWLMKQVMTTCDRAMGNLFGLMFKFTPSCFCITMTVSSYRYHCNNLWLWFIPLVMSNDDDEKHTRLWRFRQDEMHVRAHFLFVNSPFFWITWQKYL